MRLSVASLHVTGTYHSRPLEILSDQHEVEAIYKQQTVTMSRMHMMLLNLYLFEIYHFYISRTASVSSSTVFVTESGAAQMQGIDRAVCGTEDAHQITYMHRAFVPALHRKILMVTWHCTKLVKHSLALLCRQFVFHIAYWCSKALS